MAAGPLLYRPPPRWQFYAALSGAVAIHLSAYIIAAIPKHEVAEFREEKPPPPKTAVKPAGPVKAPQAGVQGTMSITGAKAIAIYAPKPEYPYEAKSRHITGSGVAVLTVDTASGNVTDASMGQSIGSPILDNATTSTFRRWRFQPGQVAPRVKVPITYTMTGASY